MRIADILTEKKRERRKGHDHDEPINSKACAKRKKSAYLSAQCKCRGIIPRESETKKVIKDQNGKWINRDGHRILGKKCGGSG